VENVYVAIMKSLKRELQGNRELRNYKDFKSKGFLLKGCRQVYNDYFHDRRIFTNIRQTIKGSIAN